MCPCPRSIVVKALGPLVLVISKVLCSIPGHVFHSFVFSLLSSFLHPLPNSPSNTHAIKLFTYQRDFFKKETQNSPNLYLIYTEKATVKILRIEAFSNSQSPFGYILTIKLSFSVRKETVFLIYGIN